MKDLEEEKRDIMTWEKWQKVRDIRGKEAVDEGK